MPAPVMYRQCEMRQATATGVARHAAWLPAEYVTGRFVRLLEEPGIWEIVSHGEARPAAIVEAYEANARRGLPSVSGHDKENA